MALAPLTAAEIEDRLNHVLEVEFTFHHTDQLAAELAQLPREEQQFALDWVRRIATTHVTLAHEFARRAMDVFVLVGEVIEHAKVVEHGWILRLGAMGSRARNFAEKAQPECQRRVRRNPCPGWRR